MQVSLSPFNKVDLVECNFHPSHVQSLSFQVLEGTQQTINASINEANALHHESQQGPRCGVLGSLP